MEKLTYFELYKKDPKIARLLIVNHYYKSKSITKTAKKFKTTRNTVRKIIKRYNEGGENNLADRPRRLQKFYRKTPNEIEEKVIKLHKRTNFGAVRLSGKLKEDNINLSPSTIGSILRRHGLSKRQRKKSFISKRVNYYEWDKIYPLEHFQIDTKEILDMKTLSKDTYFHIIKLDLPIYQWTAIDVKTRMRFLAYSSDKGFANGLAFMLIIALWLRSFGIRNKLYFQTDWGEEFGGKSIRKKGYKINFYLH